MLMQGITGRQAMRQAVGAVLFGAILGVPLLIHFGFRGDALDFILYSSIYVIASTVYASSAYIPKGLKARMLWLGVLWLIDIIGVYGMYFLYTRDLMAIPRGAVGKAMTVVAILIATLFGYSIMLDVFLRGGPARAYRYWRSTMRLPRR